MRPTTTEIQRQRAEADAESKRVEALVLRLSAFISRRAPWVSEGTAEEWAADLLGSYSPKAAGQGVIAATRELGRNELCLAALRRYSKREAQGLDASAADRALPEVAGPPSPEEARGVQVKARLVRQVLAGEVSPEDFEAEAQRHAEAGTLPPRVEWGSGLGKVGS